MSEFTVACIGAGADPQTQDMSGFSMAYRHGAAYERLDECTLLAVADVVPENARAFAEYFDIPGENVYEDYEALLAEVEPDVVSVCTPPHTHAEIVIGCARSGVVDAVHCEKPMAFRWDECERILAVAEETGVNVTFNHQRRFGKPFREAKRLLDAGDIGRLERIEMGAPNVYDYGSHSVDLCNYFNDERSAEWVIGQIDYREEDRWFGAHNENQALASWRYENGVDALAATGTTGFGLVDCHHRLVGSEGTIEIGRGFLGEGDDWPSLRVKRDGEGWENVDDDGDGLHGFETAEYGDAFIDRAIEDVIEALAAGRTSELDCRNAYRASEIIFGIWESSRRHGRVDLPLDIDDNPLDAMVDSGDVTPEPAEE